MNGRSNTIEIVQQPDQSRKNVKNKDRVQGVDENSPGLLGVGLGHPLGQSGGIQVSQGGTLLIGPGGRPKTSSGQHK